MGVAEKLCQRLNKEIPEYNFDPRWIVKYDAGDHESVYGKRFRAMGQSRTKDESVFVISYVPMSAACKKSVLLHRANAHDSYTLDYQHERKEL